MARSPSKTARRGSGKYRSTFFISLGACNNGGNSMFASLGFPIRSTFFTFAVGRLTEAVSSVSEFPVVNVTSSIQ